MTHCRAEVERWNSERMEGRVTPTMETSSPSRNRAPHKTKSAPHRRGGQPVAALGEPVWERMAGDGGDMGPQDRCICIQCKRIYCGNIYCFDMVSWPTSATPIWSAAG